MKLTPAQIDAITRRGQDVCVVAGPGSGKTRVLIERFAWLVEDQKIDPSRILAITFTEKAATEIKQRLIQRFAERFETEPELRESIERAWVSTIHGFCARLLRENAITAGLAPDFTVLDQPSAEAMAREAAENALDQMFSEGPAEMRGVLESLDLSTDDYARKPDLARSLLDVYESMRVAGLRELPKARVAEDIWPRARELAQIALSDGTARGNDVPLLREFASRLLALGDEVTLEHFAAVRSKPSFHLGRIGNGTRAHAAAKELKEEVVLLLQQQWVAIWYAGSAALLREAISRIDALYREAKRGEAAIDFAGLEEETIRLLENDPELCERTASRFDQILMDELQDTNALQWKLVALIRRSLFAVGDINQSIYGFRHAEPAVFGKYRDSLIEAGARVDDLRENHRSLPEILGAVSRVLDGQKGIEPRPLIASRCADGESVGPAVELFVGQGGEATGVDQAIGVDQERVAAEEVEASMVAARIREFCPDNRGSGRVALKDIAILVRALGATKPFERALDRFGIPFVVSGGRTFLEAREIRDVMALLAALVNPLDQIAVVGVLRSPLVGMSDEKIFALGRDGLRAEFERSLGQLRAMAGFVAPDLLLASALDECGYAAGLTDRARANVEKFLAHIRREDRRQPRPLAELLDSLEALRATQSEAEAPPPEAGNVVRVMTIHAAKGLEFPIVFVSALHRGIDQSKPVIASSPQAGLGARWRNPFTGAGQPDRAHKKIVEEIKEREAAEENRLLYVAMTRAEDHLILSYAEKKRLSGWPKLVTEALTPTRIADRVLVAPDTTAHAAHGAISVESDQWLDPPAIASRHDAAATVTSIALFHACPRKYLLTSIGGGTQRLFDGSLEKSGGEEYGADFEKGDDYRDAGMPFGSEVHRILAMEEGATEGGEMRGAAELASRFTSSEMGQRAARAARIEREFDFLFYFEDVVLRGQIDLWFEEGGELVVVDYKTDRVSDDQQFSEAYVLQLQIYALALERYAGRAADRAVLYYLRPDSAIDVPIDPDAARAAVRAFLKAQDAAGDPLNPDPMNAYPMRPGKQCRHCAFFGNLCVGTGAVEGTMDRAAG